MTVQYRASKYLDEIEETSIGTDNHFCEENVREVQESSRMLVNDICKVFGAESLKNFTPAMMNKPSVVKAQMAEWLFSAIHLLDQCSLPLMSNARVQLENLQEEKIADQKNIINLQNELISQKNEELGLVSKTVEAELKTYSSALQQSCSTALSPKNIVAAVQKVAGEDDRSREVLVFGVAEEKGECANVKVAKILEQLEEKPKFQVSKNRTAKGERSSPNQIQRQKAASAFMILQVSSNFFVYCLTVASFRDFVTKGIQKIIPVCSNKIPYQGASQTDTTDLLRTRSIRDGQTKVKTKETDNERAEIGQQEQDTPV
ncbi:hypothetical protein ACHWQZ_G015891 [Mnemiopsis leidyi]